MRNESKPTEQLARELTQAQRRVQELEAENALLRDAERRVRQVAETMHAAGLALTKTFNLDTILETLLDHLIQLVPYDSASIFLLEGGTRLVARAARGYEHWIDPKAAKLVGAVSFDLNRNPRHHSLVKTQKSLVIPDTRDDPSWEHIASSVHIRNWMGVPLVAGGETIGLYSLDKTEPHFFTEEHLRLAEALAAQAAAAIQNALLYREAQRELAERQQAQQAEHEQRVLAEALRDIAALLNSSLDFDDVLERILTHVARVVPHDAGTILLIKEDVAEATHARGYDESILGTCLPFRDMPHLLQVVETGRPSVIDDTHTSEVWVPSPETSWIRSSLTAAIGADEQTIGLLSLECDTPYAFTSEHVERLQAFANQAGVAIRNARLYASVQQAREIAETLRAANLALTQSLDLDAICEQLLDYLKRLAPYDSATIFLLEGDARLTAHAVRGYERWVDPSLALAVSFDLEVGSTIHTLVTTQRSFLVPDTTQFPAWVHTPSGEHIRSWLGVPMLSGGKVIGVCSLDSTQVATFTQEHRRLAESLAAQAAFAIENARLFIEAQEATREAQREKLYSEALIQHSPVAIVATDPAANVVTWNPAAERLFGFTAAEASGQNLDELVANHPAIHPIKADAVVDSPEVTAQAPVHAITQRTRRNGTLVDVEVWAVPVVVAGEEVRVLALYHDLTEIKRAEEALQESHRQLADIVNFMPDAVLVIDQEGKVIAWNRAIEEMTGTKAEVMLGKGNYEYALPFYGERRPILIDLVTVPQEDMEEKYSEIRMEGPVLVGETYVPRLKGGGHYLLGTASALHDSKGQVVGAIEVIRDFTERKHMEEALQQAKEAAEAATQAKSAFLATMSHEIRTPMNAVIGMTSLLLDTPLSPEQREFAETIRTSGDALLAVINDILDFSKIEAGRIDLERLPFDVRECVESALGLVAGDAAAKGLELGCWIDPQVPAGIAGDETRLRQILVNLLGNAVKFTEAGEVVVTVACDQDAETQRVGDTETSFSASPHLPVPVSLHFAVRDTGLGIPADRMDRLFQSFSQVDGSTARRFGGTGLGLAISRRLAELMGGRIWAESAGIPGQGSTFHLTLPAQPAPVLSRAELQVEAADLCGRRVLIVDDNATNRRILTLQTEAWGMEALATGSPQEALTWLRRGEPFDVALIDRLMPGLDGLTLAAEIRKLRDADALPLVMVSSLRLREEGAEGGPFAALLLKPIRASQLYDALVGILAREGPHVRRERGPARSEFDAEMGARLPLSILLAEDHPVNQKMALLMLKRLGYRADVAGNGLEVLEALERQPYDVVLMDVQMPEMDGLEATRQIRRRPSGARQGRPRPRIIAMTANVMKEDREACLAAGMDDYLGKPIRVEELVAALCRSHPLTQPAQDADEPIAPVEIAESEAPESAPPAASSATELDRAALDSLLALVGGEPALLGELIDSYLQETPKLLVALRRSLEEGNPTGLRQAAHPLKSSSRDFGATRLSEWARELEEKGKAGTLDGAEALVALVEAEYSGVKTALEAVRSGEYPWRDAT